MSNKPQSDITALLERARAGEEGAVPQLVELVYSQMHQMAIGLMHPNGQAPSLQPTDLLHEALLKLMSDNVLETTPNRAYFFAAAAKAMRRILVDHARKRNARKRGGDWQRLSLDVVLGSYESRSADLEILHEALNRLEETHERAGQVVTLRFFGGFTVDEVAKQLDISRTTAESDFRFARAWLRNQLKGTPL